MKAGPLIGLGIIGAGLALLAKGASAAETTPSPGSEPSPTPPTPSAPRPSSGPTSAPEVTLPRQAGDPIVIKPPPFPIPSPTGGPPIVVQPPPFPVLPGAGTPAANPGPLPLKSGSRGVLVAQAQRRLNAAGASPKLVDDGIFGPKTEAATRAFQGTHKSLDGKPLSVNGQIDPQTWGALLAASPTVVSGDADDRACPGLMVAAACGAAIRAVGDDHPEQAAWVERFQRYSGMPPHGAWDVPTARRAARIGFVPVAPRTWQGARQLAAWAEFCQRAAQREPGRSDEWLRAIPTEVSP